MLPTGRCGTTVQGTRLDVSTDRYLHQELITACNLLHACLLHRYEVPDYIAMLHRGLVVRLIARMLMKCLTNMFQTDALVVHCTYSTTVVTH